MLQVMNKAVPVVLESLGSTFKDLAVPICDAFVKYGYRNQIAVTKIAVAIIPEFAKVSNRFFDLLDKVVDYSEVLDSQEYNIILQLVLQDEQSNLQEKTSVATEFIKTLKDNQFDHKSKLLNIITKTMTVMLSIIGLTVIICKALSVYQQTYRQKEKTHRAKTRSQIISNLFTSIAKSMNPFSIFVDIYSLYLSKK